MNVIVTQQTVLLLALGAAALVVGAIAFGIWFGIYSERKYRRWPFEEALREARAILVKEEERLAKGTRGCKHARPDPPHVTTWQCPACGEYAYCRDCKSCGACSK